MNCPGYLIGVIFGRAAANSLGFILWKVLSQIDGWILDRAPFKLKMNTAYLSTN
jgi:hypothetical protein